MSDLGPAAREMVESHRRDRRLSDTDRARIKHKLMLRVSTLGATTAFAGTAAGMSLASKIVLVALGVTAAVGAGSFSLWVSQARAPSHLTSGPVSGPKATDRVAPTPGPAAMPMAAAAAPVGAPAPDPAVMPAIPSAPASAPAPGRAAMPMVAAAAPASAPAPDPAATLAVASAPDSSVPVDLRRRDHVRKMDKRPVVSASERPTPAATLVVPPDPEPELRALREARDDLRAGRPASAYRRLDDFDRQSRGGMLAQERSALSAIALCRSQPGPGGQARAAEFLRRSPESPLATRVRSACEQALKGSP